jgi:hypothetical protein
MNASMVPFSKQYFTFLLSSAMMFFYFLFEKNVHVLLKRKYSHKEKFSHFTASLSDYDFRNRILTGMAN